MAKEEELVTEHQSLPAPGHARKRPPAPPPAPHVEDEWIGEPLIAKEFQKLQARGVGEHCEATPGKPGYEYILPSVLAKAIGSPKKPMPRADHDEWCRHLAASKCYLHDPGVVAVWTAPERPQTESDLIPASAISSLLKTTAPVAPDPKQRIYAAIRYDLLTSLTPLPDGVQDAEYAEAIRAVFARLEEHKRVQQAYAGWLVTNREFVADHDAFIHRWKDAITLTGMPQAPTKSMAQNDYCVPEPELLADLTGFLQKWELAQLVAPGLPLPLSSQDDCSTTDILPAHGEDAIVLVVQPRTLTVPMNDRMASAVQNRREFSTKDHLQPWFDVVGKHNKAKQSLDRYARLLSLRLYWSVLHKHHPSLCHRNRVSLVTAFAKFLQVSQDTIKKDLKLISHSLGADWAVRPDPLAG